MTEVILNDECMHCNDKECHDGEHFCNQAMKKNSFYKNAELYRGLEVIHRPTYEELEKEAEEKYHNHKIVDFQGFYNHHYYYLGYVESAEPREKRIAELEIENGKLERKVADWQSEYTELENFKNNEIDDLKKQINDLLFRIEHIRADGIELLSENDNKFNKAIELLKGIMDTPMYNQRGGEMYENKEYKELIAEAEQFLKDSKIEKMPEEKKIDSNNFLLDKVTSYRSKHHMTDSEQKVISMDCALLGWHACIEWLEKQGVDIHKAFDKE